MDIKCGIYLQYKRGFQKAKKKKPTNKSPFGLLVILHVNGINEYKKKKNARIRLKYK